MKMHAFRSLLFVLAAVLMAASGAAAQTGNGSDQQPQIPLAPAGTVASAITYQGVLRENGTLVTGSRTMTFQIWDNSSCTGTAWSTETFSSVSVSEGLFSVRLNMPQPFNGQGAWLRVKVGGTSLGCQEMLAAPYALTLRPGATISGAGTTLYLSSSSGTALEATTYASSGGAVAAVSGKSTAISGGKFGVMGEIASQSDWTVATYGHATATSGITTGVWGQTESTTDGARGVTGWAHASSGATIGVRGDSESPTGMGVAGYTNAGTGVYGRAETGWAAVFDGMNGPGVWIHTQLGKEALGVNQGDVVVDLGNLVVGGTKSAVVNSAEGKRLLYAEESAEVWFTDYGFGQLTDGKAVIVLDPLFAQTVNLTEPYHVFVQAYGDAVLYVANRSAGSFEVRLHEGQADVEFSYRMVARRLGYEEKRLAPWSDNTPSPASHNLGTADTRGLPNQAGVR